MTQEIERIRAALSDATHGPWIGAGPSFGKPLPEYLDSVVQDIDGDDSAPTICDNTETADANYIAACNPAAMTAVLAFIDAQVAEIERMRADAARYRLRRDELIDFKPAGYDGRDVGRFDLVLDSVTSDLDATIDAEMKETP